MGLGAGHGDILTRWNYYGDVPSGPDFRKRAWLVNEARLDYFSAGFFYFATAESQGNEEPRRKQRGIGSDQIGHLIAASCGELTRSD